MFQKYLDRQYRRPAGLLGRWVGRMMAQQHQPENLWTISLLNAQPTDRILEVGFGPGFAIQQLVARLPNEFVAGVDFSKTMVKTAAKRNAEAVKAKWVDLRYGDAAYLPFGDGEFHKAYSIHSIYFWPKPLDALAELRRVLKPGGMLILTIMPKEKMSVDAPDGLEESPDFKAYSGDELSRMLAAVDFRDLRIEADDRDKFPSNYSVIGVK